jgi:predicted nucleic acid-binding protein
VDCFFDSSALAKLYHSEIGTPTVDEIVRNAGSRVRISRLTVVEMSSIFAVKVRTQFITRDDAWFFLRQFREDLVSRSLEVFAVREEEFALAQRLVERYALDRRLRTLDAVQLAVALGLRAAGLIEKFVAADKALCEVAALEGFSVLNPEQP